MGERRLKCIPLRNVAIVGGIITNIDIKRSFSIKAAELAFEEDNGYVFVVCQVDGAVVRPEFSDMYRVGTLVKIIERFSMPGGVTKLMVKSEKNCPMIDFDYEDGMYHAVITDEELYTSSEEKLEILKNMCGEVTEELFRESPRYPMEISKELSRETDEDARLNKLAQYVFSVDNQQYIEYFDRIERYEYVVAKIRDELNVISVEKSVEDAISNKMQNVNRDYILREQKKAIEEELGDSLEDDELAVFRKKIDTLNVSDDLKKKFLKEVDKLGKIHPSSADYFIVYNYIEYVLELPWNTYKDDRDDIKEVQRILDEDHYGLEKVKERIIEYLAVRKLTNGNNKGTILCLVGPPGVGKTSIAKSIAGALDKEYIQMSLGGIHDEAEIRGHRRTYVGAMPGRIISSMHNAKTSNPLFLLDEIDKVYNDMKGDPSSALLEVLDPVQNVKFRDNYLEVPYDLSKVMFIATANNLSTIKQPLLDRMEIIEMGGYTEYEKLNIAKKYLIRKQMLDSGVDNITFSDGALLEIIRNYTREAGVRNLEREIGNVCRKAARKIVEGGVTSFKITQSNVAKYLGIPKFTDSEIENGVGVCTGLAWTGAGGDTLSIEVSAIDGKGELVLTGHLGDVMKESARTALSVVRSRASEFGIDKTFFEKHDIHIHVPEGATPKDGPSAGITMTTAIMSAVTGRAIVKGLAMTGEITLRGNVLGIGGLKEKSLAAHRLGVKKIVVPKDNIKDIDEIPNIVKNSIEFIPVGTIDQVFNISYGV